MTDSPSSTTPPVAVTAAAKAVFYNMTGEDVTMTVNRDRKTSEEVLAIPSTSPYTPNHNSNPYTRVKYQEAQSGQFGSSNTLYYYSPDSFDISVVIDVDITAYPVTNPLLIFMFRDAVVVTCPSDSVAYTGHDKDTIKVSPTMSSSTL